MNFVKMHGLGNDYVYVNCFEERVADAAVLARAISDRHTGVGSDGLILVGPSKPADVRMQMFNADGSRAEMCGNGIRCVAKYAVDRALVAVPSDACPNDPCIVHIETDAGVKTCRCSRMDGVVRTVRVNMGRPALDRTSIPSTIPGDRIVNHRLRIEYPGPRAKPAPMQSGECANLPSSLIITCVSMGNPHAVIFVDNLESIDLNVVGPLVTNAPSFPNRINTHFAYVNSPQHVTMMTWERGSGATRGCGTGACAVCVAGALTKRTKRKFTATLPGGDLDLDWADDDHVYMTGPAVEVFSGRWPI